MHMIDDLKRQLDRADEQRGAALLRCDALSAERWRQEFIRLREALRVANVEEDERIAREETAERERRKSRLLDLDREPDRIPTHFRSARYR